VRFESAGVDAAGTKRRLVDYEKLVFQNIIGEALCTEFPPVLLYRIAELLHVYVCYARLK
jgi:hypothetical protein